MGVNIFQPSALAPLAVLATLPTMADYLQYQAGLKERSSPTQELCQNNFKKPMTPLEPEPEQVQISA